MRTVIVKSDGFPNNSHIIDAKTGDQIDGIQRIVFSYLDVDVQKPWTAVLWIADFSHPDLKSGLINSPPVRIEEVFVTTMVEHKERV